MWEKVAKRRHDPVKVYPFGPNADECMLYGIVAYELKAGGSFTVDWAARALLTKEDGIVKLADYQVYLVLRSRSSIPLLWQRSANMHAGYCRDDLKVLRGMKQSDFVACRDGQCHRFVPRASKASNLYVPITRHEQCNDSMPSFTLT